MTIEEAAEFMEDAPYVSGKKNQIGTGLNILAKYSDDITVVAEHDHIWAYTSDDAAADVVKMSKADLRELADLGWRIDLDNGGFHRFV